MKTTVTMIKKYEADEGKVFDWADPHYSTDEEGNEVQDHLYAKVIYLNPNVDDISNYIEIEVAANEDTE